MHTHLGFHGAQHTCRPKAVAGVPQQLPSRSQHAVRFGSSVQHAGLPQWARCKPDRCYTQLRGHASAQEPSAPSACAPAPSSDSQLLGERGTSFITGTAFYRAESAQGRDLAVLVASVYKQRTGSLRVLDLMAGSAVRGARYMTQAGADEVWANDYNPATHPQLIYNLNTAAQHCCKEPALGHMDTGSGRNTTAPTTDTLTAEQSHNVPPDSELSGVVRQWDEQSQLVTLPGLRRPVRQRVYNLVPGRNSSTAQDITQELITGPQSAHETHSNDPLQHAAHSDPTHSGQDTGSPGSRTTPPDPSSSPQGSVPPATGKSVTVKVSHMDAKRLLAALYLAEDYYDLIDIDSFGSDTSFLGAAIDAVQYGGLLYLTSTDGFSSGGRRPTRSLGAYGCWTRSTPWANEQGLRMLIGAAVKEGAARGVTLTPVFSLFSYHGPVFRVMLRVKRSALWPSEQYQFAGHCPIHGLTHTVPWSDLGAAKCRCCCSATTPAAHTSSHKLNIAGPMWTGPLHDRQEVLDMIQEADKLGWRGHSPDAGLASFAESARTKKNGPRPLEEVLQVMLEESDERLPPGYIPIDTLGKYLVSYPPRDKLIQELRALGFAAARCHLDAKAFRTDAFLPDILTAASHLGIARRADSPV